MEPSGDPFNSMIKLEYKSAIPSNPLINAGAIAVAGLMQIGLNLKTFSSS